MDVRKQKRETAEEASARRLEELREWRAWAKVERDALRQRLEEEFTDVPKCVRNDLWNWAWEEGHSAGLREVELYYQDVAPIVEKAVRKGGE